MARRLVFPLLLHFIFLGLTLSGGLSFLYNDAERRLGQGADFFAVYQAGREADSGCTIYSETDCSPAVPYHYAYRYLPVFALSVGRLLALVPPWTAYWLWVTALEALFLAGMLLTTRAARTPMLARANVWLWVGASPYYLELFMGQFSFLMGILLLAMVWALASGRRHRAVSTWTFSLLTKGSSSLAAPLLLRLLGWRPMLFAGLTVVSLNAPYFVLVPGSFAAYRGNLDSLGSPAPLHAGAQSFPSLVGVVDHLFMEGNVRGEGSPGSALVSLVVGAIVAFGSLTVVWRRPDPLAGTIVCTGLYFLLFPDVWEHTYSMLVPLLAYAAMTHPGIGTLAIAIWLVVDLPTPYFLLEAIARQSPGFSARAFDPQALWPGWGIVAQHALRPLSVLVLVVVASLTLLRNRKAPNQESHARQAEEKPSIRLDQVDRQ